MTQGHRLTVAYAIIVTALLLGIAHGNRHLLALEHANPDLQLSQPQRNHIAMRWVVPYFVGGVVVSLVVFFTTRRKTEPKE